MSRPCAAFSRRSLIATTAALLAPAGWAQGGLSFPLRMAYVRVGPDGLLPARDAEKSVWSAMKQRTGGLIEVLLPLPVGGMLGLAPPASDGGADCALAARRLAAEEGLPHVLLYAVDDGSPRAPAPGTHWLDRMFLSIRDAVAFPQDAVAEAHLLDVRGGRPLVSATSDRPPRTPVSLTERFAKQERRALEGVASAFERRLQDAARPLYRAQRSIAD